MLKTQNWLCQCIICQNTVRNTDTTGSLSYNSQDEPTKFNKDIANTNNFKSFKDKAKLLGNIVAQPAANNNNGILKYAKIALPLKYLSNFRKVVDM